MKFNSELTDYCLGSKYKFDEYIIYHSKFLQQIHENQSVSIGSILTLFAFFIGIVLRNANNDGHRSACAA